MPGGSQSPVAQTHSLDNRHRLQIRTAKTIALWSFGTRCEIFQELGFPSSATLNPFFINVEDVPGWDFKFCDNLTEELEMVGDDRPIECLGTFAIQS